MECVSMSQNVNLSIKRLVNYAVSKKLIEEQDRVYITNAILAILKLDEYTEPENIPDVSDDDLEEILSDLCDYAYENKLIVANSTEYRDLFDTSLMGVLTPRPSFVIHEFMSLYREDPRAATEYFYKLCRDNDYIRTYRIKKDLKWAYNCEYGDIDITINLSKPEKDPKAIAAAKLLPQSGYPKCLLCRENEGYAGTLRSPARQNIRHIPLDLASDRWFMQYSPYVYYNEHCIVFSQEHTPMKITRQTFARMLDFVEFLPHYFIGSNADLPIVGGSILTHDHMQGGSYTFAMTKAPIEREISFEGYSDVKSGIVRWPMSVIRLRSADKAKLVELSDKILAAWRGYTDEDAFIFAETDGAPHNTITPIARMRDGEFELDLVLRNNITTDEHPLGVYHPHAQLHNIKKENIGLIEVMGLAVLPSRLKNEIELLADAIIEKKDISSIPEIEKHSEWVARFADKYEFTPENVRDILKSEIGDTFVHVLEDAGVYKCNDEGRRAFMRFVGSVK